MSSAILNDADWSIFLVSYFEEMCQFINGGEVNDSVCVYLNLDKKRFWELPAEFKVSKTEAFNAAKAFKDEIGELNSLINNILQHSDLTTTTIRDAYTIAESVLLTIVDNCMGLDPNDIQSNDGTFHKCCLGFSKHIIEKGYPGVKVTKKDGSVWVSSERVHLPFWTVKDIRNKLHAKKTETRYTTPEIKGSQQGMELGKFLIFSLIQIIALGHKMGILKKPVGETVNLEIPYEFSYVKYKTGGNQEGRIERNGDKPYNLEIADIYRYEGIDIEVFITGENSIRFNTIQLDCSHLDNVKIRLGNKSMEYEIESIDLAKEKKKETASLTFKTDLDCTLEISGIAKIVEVQRGKEVKVDVSKGMHSITLASARNPRYKVTREIDIAEDTVINDVLFAKEVHNHREWWDIKDIVILKKTFDNNRFVLWDRSVELPVYFCPCDDDKSETGFAGNFFYVKQSDGFYRYYDLSVPGNDHLSENLFTFNRGYEFTGYRGFGDALVIDKNGALLYTIFKSIKRNSSGLYDIIDWPDALKENYDSFIRQFQFSEGWAAMLKPDGTIHFVNEDWIADSKYSYSYDCSAYPLFHNGYCAVKKGHVYLFIEDKGGYLEETVGEYEYLQTVEVKGDWAYIAKTDTGYGIMDPAKNRFLLPPVFQSIEAAHGLFRVELNGKSGILDSNLNDVLNLIGGDICLLSDAFFIESINTNGDLKHYLGSKDSLIAVHFKRYELIYDCASGSANLIAVQCYDDKWKICDTTGKERLKDYDEFMYYGSGIFLLKKGNTHEYWILKGNSLRQMTDVDFLFVEQSDVYFYIINARNVDKDNEIVTLEFYRLNPMTGDEQFISKRLTIRCKDYVNLFLDNYAAAKQIKGMDRKNMEDTISKYSDYYEIYNRIGKLWINDKEQVYSNEKLVADECKEVIPISEDLYYIKYSNSSLTSHIMADDGKRFHLENYRQIRPIVHGFAAVQRTGWGFIGDISGKTGTARQICNLEYEAVKDFTKEGYAMVRKKDSGWGLIDTSGGLVVECRYDYVESFRCGFTSALKDGYWSIINKKGQEVITKKQYLNMLRHSMTRINENDFLFIDD